MGADQLAPQDLHASVSLYRDVNTTDHDRAQILAWWGANGIPNQFAAMLRAADLDMTTTTTSEDNTDD